MKPSPLQHRFCGKLPLASQQMDMVAACAAARTSSMSLAKPSPPERLPSGAEVDHQSLAAKATTLLEHGVPLVLGLQLLHARHGAAAAGPGAPEAMRLCCDCLRASTARREARGEGRNVPAEVGQRRRRGIAGQCKAADSPRSHYFEAFACTAMHWGERLRAGPGALHAKITCKGLLSTKGTYVTVISSECLHRGQKALDDQQLCHR